MVLGIGNEGAANSEDLFGKLDDVSIWNKSINDIEMEHIVNKQDLTEFDNLLGYYIFNNGSGNILYDHSGNETTEQYMVQLD